MKDSYYKRPKGLCDMCRKNKAEYWFGDTSVALCHDEACVERNRAQWNAMLEEMRQDEDSNY